MKSSHRVEKATYNDERESSYKTEINKIAWRTRIKIEDDGESTYVVDENSRKLLCTPIIKKHFWYETWLALKTYCGE